MTHYPFQISINVQSHTQLLNSLGLVLQNQDRLSYHIITFDESVDIFEGQSRIITS